MTSRRVCSGHSAGREQVRPHIAPSDHNRANSFAIAREISYRFAKVLGFSDPGRVSCANRHLYTFARVLDFSDPGWSERAYPVTNQISCFSMCWIVIWICLTGHSSVTHTCVICGKASCRASRLGDDCTRFRLAMSFSIVVGTLQAIMIEFARL